MGRMSRRKFVQLAGASGSLVASGSLFSMTASASPLGLPFGIQLYTVSIPLRDDVPGTLAKLYEIGYREVETAGFGNYTAQQFRGLLDAAGLKCPSAHLPLTGDDLSGPLADAHALGVHFATSSVLRTFHFPPRPANAAPGSAAPMKFPPLPPLGLDGFKAMAEHMNRVGQQVHDAGLQYAYHNHNFEFEKMPDGSYGYDLLLKETDPELVKFEIDCGWMVVAGANPVDYFRKDPGRFRMLHIKDFKRPPQPTAVLGGPNRPEGTELGEGFVDYGPIFAAARTAGIVHVFAEEEAPYPGSQLDAAKANYAFLARFH